MRGRILGVVALCALLAGACGDPYSDDPRGYTKAPLEDPNLLIDGEEVTAMSDLNVPDRPRVSLELAEQVVESATEEAAEAAPVTLAEGVTQAQFDQGQEVFAGVGGCTACHGPQGSGSTLGPDLTDAEWLHIPGPELGALAGVITQGVPNPINHPAPMPPMGGASLTEDQVQSLAAYIASLAAS